MNPKVFFGLACLACVLSITNATLGTIGLASAGTGAAITLTGLGAATGTTGFLTASGVALAGGALLFKAAALGIAAPELLRGKRSVGTKEVEIDIAVAAIAQNEPAQCYRRLICDLATGAMPKSDEDVILNLFNNEVAPESPRFDFVTAAKIGKQLKNVPLCEYRYSCPLSGSEIVKILS